MFVGVLDFIQHSNLFHNMKIYIVTKSVYNSFGDQILGAYKEFSDAQKRAAIEPPMTKLGWQETDNQNDWHNGAGLSLSIKELEVN